MELGSFDSVVVGAGDVMDDVEAVAAAGGWLRCLKKGFLDSEDVDDAIGRLAGGGGAVADGTEGCGEATDSDGVSIAVSEA